MKYYLLFMCSFLTQLINAQQLAEEQPRWVLGTEANFLFQDIDYSTSNFRYYGLGIQVEKPIGDFSLGTGLIQQQFGEQYFRTTSGQYRPAENGGVETFGFDRSGFQLSFINIPLRLQYRLPCNCAYVQAGLQSSFRQLKASPYGNRHEFLTDQSTSAIYSMSNIKSFSLGYELAFGMNIHISRSFKMFGRLSYLQYGFSNDDAIKYKELGNTFMGLNIGLQYAIY